MIYFNMNNQLKLLVYIVLLAGAFIYVQDRFKLFDISLSDSRKKEVKEEIEEESSNTAEEVNYVEIFISEGDPIKVNVEVADNDIKRASGLSNRKYLGDYDGMLFVFEEKTNRPFWMKDMLINLDILFLDESGFIVEIASDNEICTEYHCPAISSVHMYKYVLEVNAGFCKNNAIQVGQNVVFHLAKSM